MDQEKSIKIEIVKETVSGGNISVISLNGYIDSYNSQYFQNTLMSLITEGDKNLIIDAGLLSYVSSAGIGAFMALSRKLDDNDGNLIIANLNTKVLEVFNLLGFTSFFKILPDRDAAKSAMMVNLGATDTSGNSASSSSIPTVEPSVMSQIIFPLIFACPKCAKRLKAMKAARYKCLNCQTIISVDEQGNVK
jgi:anti-sigma B factor antagonist